LTKSLFYGIILIENKKEVIKMLIAIFLMIFTIGLIFAFIGNTIMCIKEKWYFTLVGLDLMLGCLIGFSIDTIIEIFTKIL
jgi:hypothetical protein